MGGKIGLESGKTGVF